MKKLTKGQDCEYTNLLFYEYFKIYSHCTKCQYSRKQNPSQSGIFSFPATVPIEYVWRAPKLFFTIFFFCLILPQKSPRLTKPDQYTALCQWEPFQSFAKITHCRDPYRSLCVCAYTSPNFDLQTLIVHVHVNKHCHCLHSQTFKPWRW